MDRVIEKKHGFQRKHIYFVVAGFAVVALLAWIIFGNHSNTLNVDADDLTICSVTKGEFKDYVMVDGQVVPIQVVQISPEEGGIVKEKVVEEGAKVKKGDVIMRLSNSDLDLQILNAEAELAEKQNLLRNTQITMQQDRLSNETENASLDMDVRRKLRNYQQNERLYNKGLICREEYQQSKEDYELAQKKQGLIKQRLKQDAAYRKAQMAQMQENLCNMRKNVLLVRDRKEKLEIRSAIDGELGLLDVELGQSIAAGQKVGQINDLSSFKIEAQIDEHYIDRVKTGLTATFEKEGKGYTLNVRKVYPEVRDGKFKVEFVFYKSTPSNLRSGQTYYLNLALGKSNKAMLVARGAFFQTTGGNWIFVLDKDGHRAYKRTIRINRQNPQYYEVVEGLEPGEQVITSGYESFKDAEVLDISE